MSDVKFTEYEDSTILWMIDEKAKEFLNKYEINEIQSFKKISDDVFIINMCWSRPIIKELTSMVWVENSFLLKSEKTLIK